MSSNESICVNTSIAKFLSIPLLTHCLRNVGMTCERIYLWNINGTDLFKPLLLCACMCPLQGPSMLPLPIQPFSHPFSYSFLFLQFQGKLCMPRSNLSSRYSESTTRLHHVMELCSILLSILTRTESPSDGLSIAELLYNSTPTARLVRDSTVTTIYLSCMTQKKIYSSS